MDELLYTVAGDKAFKAAPISLAEAGLREREHLQEWVLSHPEMLGESLLVITSECDRWSSVRGRERDRLDVLALDPDGHLVIVELKRDMAPETVELQALKYAAYASRFTPETLVAEFRAWRERQGAVLDEAAATAQLEAHLAEDVGGLADAPLGAPRIVLLAGGFTQSTTAVAVWLREMGVDITLRALRAYATESGPVVSVSAVYPLPSVEEFTVSPLLAERKREEADRRAARAEPAVRQLLASGALQPGTELHVRPAGPDAEVFAAWVAEGVGRDRAVWAGTPSRPLRWAAEDAAGMQATGNFSVTGLVRWLYQQASATVPAGAATALVATADGRTLAELAGTGGGPSSFDAAGLHRLLAALPGGRWASYGDIASLVGTAAQPLGRHVTSCPRCEHAWRVLQDSGRPATGFRWSDPERIDTQQAVLEGEGVRFTAGVADPHQRLSVPELQDLLAPTG